MRSFKPTSAVLGRVAALALALLGPAARVGSAQDAAALARTMAEARAWLDAGGAGPTVGTPEGVRSAAAVLRLRGRVLGLGKDPGTASPAGPVDGALRAAFADATGKAPSRTAAPADAKDLGRAVTLELEFAGQRVPLIGRTFEEAMRRVEPAECGLQLADGDRTAFLPASFLLARNMAAPASRGIVSLVRELGLPALDLPELQELGGRTALYACPGVRVVERRPGGELALPCRLLPSVPPEAPPRAWSMDACAKIVERLERQLEVAPAGEGIPPDAAAQVARTGLRGDYLLVPDSYEPLSAGPADQALVGWALARAGTSPAWPQALRDRAAATSRRVLAALADADPSERDPAADPASVACIVLAAADLGGTGELPEGFARRMDAALAAHLAPAALSMARPHARALLLAAAAARRNDAEPPLPAERLSTEVAAALAAVVPAELPAVAPFLFDALRRIHGPDWHGSLDPAASRAAEAARAVLVATQVTAGDDAAGRRVPDDAVGAYPAAGSASGRASAQSLRMHLFMAMLAGSTGDGDVARDLADRRSLGLANRFLRQLQVPPSIDWFAPAPDRALGGILASPAEAAQPVAAQAIAVLALCETDIALERLDSRAAAAGNGGIGGSSPAR